MFPKDVYIDLGTNNTLIYARKQGLLLNEPSILAHYSKNKTHRTTCGAQAKKMLGKTPQSYSINHPLREGVVIDFERSKKMLSSFLYSANNSMLLSRQRILISLPFHVNKYEKEMFRSLAYELGAGIVHLISEPLAGAIGSGVHIFKNKAFMFIDCGAGTTEIIITFNGQIVRSDAIRIGGNNIDLSIMDILKHKYHFNVGEQTAETIKKKVATFDKVDSLAQYYTASGINLETGLPEKRTIDSTMIYPALLSTFDKVIKILSKVFDECPPDLIPDIFDNGVLLFGGNSAIPGLDNFLSKTFGIKFKTTRTPLMSVAIGGSKVLDNDQLFDDLKLCK
jgi:rod shape-determining protein MreB